MVADAAWFVEDRGPIEGVKGRLPGAPPLTIITGNERLSPNAWLDQRLAYARTSNRSASLPAGSPRSLSGAFPRSPNRKLVKPPPSPLIGSPVRARLFGSISRKLSSSGPLRSQKVASTLGREVAIPTVTRETWVIDSAASELPRTPERTPQQIWPHTAAGHPAYGAAGWPVPRAFPFGPVEQGFSPTRRESYTLVDPDHEDSYASPSPLSGRGGGPRAPNRSAARRPSVPLVTPVAEGQEHGPESGIDGPRSQQETPAEGPITPRMTTKPSSASLHAAMRSSGTFGFSMGGERRRSSSESAVIQMSDAVSMRQRGSASSDVPPGNQLGLHDPPETQDAATLASEAKSPKSRQGSKEADRPDITVNTKRPSAGSSMSRLSESHPFSPTRMPAERGSTGGRDTATFGGRSGSHDSQYRSESRSHGRGLAENVTLPTSTMLGTGGLGDLPLLIATQVLQSHAGSLARLACSLGHKSAEVNRMAADAREWADSLSRMAKSRKPVDEESFHCETCDSKDHPGPRRSSARRSAYDSRSGSMEADEVDASIQTARVVSTGRRTSDAAKRTSLSVPSAATDHRRGSSVGASRRNSWIVSDATTYGSDPMRLGLGGRAMGARPLSNISEQHSSLRRLSSVAPDEHVDQDDVHLYEVPEDSVAAPVPRISASNASDTTRRRPLSELPPRTASLAFNRHETPSWLQNMPPLPQENPRLQHLQGYALPPSQYHGAVSAGQHDHVPAAKRTRGSGLWSRLSIFGSGGGSGKKTDKKSKRMTFSATSVSPRTISSPIPFPAIEHSLFYEHVGPPPPPPPPAGHSHLLMPTEFGERPRSGLVAQDVQRRKSSVASWLG